MGVYLRIVACHFSFQSISSSSTWLVSDSLLVIIYFVTLYFTEWIYAWELWVIHFLSHYSLTDECLPQNCERFTSSQILPLSHFYTGNYLPENCFVPTPSLSLLDRLCLPENCNRTTSCHYLLWLPILPLIHVVVCLAVVSVSFFTFTFRSQSQRGTNFSAHWVNAGNIWSWVQ